ncbi:AbiH family protein, partial [Klebsiella pneumoniae]
MRLYVIGNGFDIRHGLPTRFCCFEAYVKRHNQKLYKSISNFVPTEDEWNDLESALGNFDYDGAFEENSGFLMSPGDDEWRDSANHDFPYEIEQITQRLIKELPLALRDWINAIDLSRALTPP